jgi:hypothetical protein
MNWLKDRARPSVNGRARCGDSKGGASVLSEKADRSSHRCTNRSAQKRLAEACRRFIFVRGLSRWAMAGVARERHEQRRALQLGVDLWSSTWPPCPGASGRLVIMMVADALHLQAVGGSQGDGDRLGGSYISQLASGEAA